MDSDVDLIPEISRHRRTTAVAELPLQQAKPFQEVLTRFIGVFARPKSCAFSRRSHGRAARFDLWRIADAADEAPDAIGAFEQRVDDASSLKRMLDVIKARRNGQTYAAPLGRSIRAVLGRARASERGAVLEDGVEKTGGQPSSPFSSVFARRRRTCRLRPATRCGPGISIASCKRYRYVVDRSREVARRGRNADRLQQDGLFRQHR